MSEQRRGRPRGRPQGTSHDEIRDVALRLFLDHGYAHTSLARIAQAAGISRTTLFAYFPSKRDILWEDHDRRAAQIDEAVATGADRPVADLIVRGLLAGTRYTVAEHDTMATRLRIVDQDDELRAYAALAAQDTTQRVIDAVVRRAPRVDADRVELIARALAAAAAPSTRAWATHERPDIDLDAFALQRIGPLIDALRPLLP